MKKITSIRPIGTLVLVELLSAQETLSTVIHVNNNAKNIDIPQARVLSWGHSFDAEKYNIKKNDRVILTGTYIECPRMEDNKNLALVQFTEIKAVLEESE